jgi:hypothetical protein
LEYTPANGEVTSPSARSDGILGVMTFRNAPSISRNQPRTDACLFVNSNGAAATARSGRLDPPYLDYRTVSGTTITNPHLVCRQ